MKKTLQMTFLALAGITFGAATDISVAAASTATPTNSVMFLNFALTAWPDATATPRLQALRQTISQLNSATPSAAVTFMPIIGITNDYFPDVFGDGTTDSFPGDVVVDLPPDLVDTIPFDPGVSDGGADVDGGDANTGIVSPMETFVPVNAANTLKALSAATATPKVATPFRISSKDIVTSLNGVTNRGTAMQFNSSARLMFKQVLSPLTLTVNTLGTNRQIIVRQKVSGRAVDTDVTSFFSANDNYISKATSGGATTSRKLSSLSFINANKLNLQLSALLKEVTVPTKTNGVMRLNALSGTVQGSGQLSGSTPNLIISGEISTSGKTLE